ncbi:MAG: PEP-CTERM sorting domain-containing protein [Acidobacteria bacterium]|nr:PEP-CTERM sorting domain-containing protein [Acidobacteriota bacterium]
MFVFLLLIAGSAWASSISMSFDPTPVERNIGEPWELDINLDGNYQLQQGVLVYYHIDFRYDSGVIEFQSATFGNSVLNGWSGGSTSYEDLFFDPGDPYNLNKYLRLKISGVLFEGSSIAFNPPDNLFATVLFKAVGIGESVFSHRGGGFAGSGLGDDYEYLSFYQTAPGHITVSGEAQVPEPSTLFLLGFGLIGLASLRRRK